MRWFYCESYTILDLAIIFGQDYAFRLIPKKKDKRILQNYLCSTRK